MFITLCKIYLTYKEEFNQFIKMQNNRIEDKEFISGIRRQFFEFFKKEMNLFVKNDLDLRFIKKNSLNSLNYIKLSKQFIAKVKSFYLN